jgi:hypothetical protein
MILCVYTYVEATATGWNPNCSKINNNNNIKVTHSSEYVQTRSGSNTLENKYRSPLDDPLKFFWQCVVFCLRL